MSKDLDSKLKDVLAQPHANSMGETVMTFITDKTVQQIKDCFIADGWVKPFKLSKDKSWERCPICSSTEEHTHETDLMTGEEYYKKFLQELEGTIFAEDDALGALNTCKAAAKRASGVKR